MSFAVTFDERSGDEGHEGDGQELSQRPPREDIIHGGDLREDGARTNADKVVWDQTWRKNQQLSDWFVVLSVCVSVCFVCV